MIFLGQETSCECTTVFALLQSLEFGLRASTSNRAELRVFAGGSKCVGISKERTRGDEIQFSGSVTAKVTEMKTMKVKVLPYNYIGHIVEHGLLFHTVRLASGALLIAPTYLIEVIE